MKVKVLFFAGVRERTGVGQVEIDIPSATTVGGLRAKLAQLWPSVGPLLSRSTLAVDERIAEDEVEIPADAVVAVVPPVSGG